VKVLLFFSGQDSLSKSFKKGFIENSWDVKLYNYQEFNGDIKNIFYERSILFPKKLRRVVEKEYLDSIQEKYIEVVVIEKPDLVLIYNDQMVEASTIRKIRKISKVAVYLADSPFFLQRREHILPMLFEIDHLFAPDTFWIEQLKSIGIGHSSFLIGGYNLEDETISKLSEEDILNYSSDLFFLGSPYNDSWGYKRALFLSKFSKMNIKIYGPKGWEYWFRYFPELEGKMVLGERISFSVLQKLMRCSKIYPVDANPGIINGLHIRIFDSIASGMLPLVEYKKDLERAFPGYEIPVIKDYSEITGIVNKLLENDSKRVELVNRLQLQLKETYSPQKVVLNLLKALF
jgi:spore maturation protein CgeB